MGKPGMVVQAFNPSISKAEADGSLGVQGQLSLHIESQAYTVSKIVSQTNQQTTTTKRGTQVLRPVLKSKFNTLIPAITNNLGFLGPPKADLVGGKGYTTPATPPG